MADERSTRISVVRRRVPGTGAGAFRECTGLGSENEVVEYKASGPKGEYVIKKVPGRIKWNNITLKRGITRRMDMWKWRKLVEEGKIDEARKNGSMVMFDTAGDGDRPLGLRQCLAEQDHRPDRQRHQQRGRHRRAGDHPRGLQAREVGRPHPLAPSPARRGRVGLTR